MIKPRVGISSCLMGEKVRYDGGHKLMQTVLAKVGGWVEWVPFCPEVAMGLGVPREPMHARHGVHGLELVGNQSGSVFSDFLSWNTQLNRVFDGYVFKSKSPLAAWISLFSLRGHAHLGLFRRELRVGKPQSAKSVIWMIVRRLFRFSNRFF